MQPTDDCARCAAGAEAGSDSSACASHASASFGLRARKASSATATLFSAGDVIASAANAPDAIHPIIEIVRMAVLARGFGTREVSGSNCARAKVFPWPPLGKINVFVRASGEPTKVADYKPPRMNILVRSTLPLIVLATIATAALVADKSPKPAATPSTK